MATENNKGILSLNIKGKSALYVSYMPFIKNGGIFIPSNKSDDYALGDDIFVLLTIDGSKDKIPIAGKVSWITPKGAHGKKTEGIGIQFSELDKGATKTKIEKMLAGALSSERPSHTL
ncbi:MAG: pilus assembly protein PilZ [Legionellales bacterium]|nr:pilus assembly protein PilZ [Legionellales bacterium]